jgi:hypothetical protein
LIGNNGIGVLLIELDKQYIFRANGLILQIEEDSEGIFGLG